MTSVVCDLPARRLGFRDDDIIEDARLGRSGFVSEPSRRRPPLGEFGLSIVLGVLFLLSWLGQLVFQAVEVGNEAVAHGQEFAWSDFWPAFLQATFENWQSEFLQLFSFVVLATYFIHRDSPQSRDGNDEMKAQLDRIEALLDGK